MTTRLIEVYAARNSQPAVFLLTPEKDVEPGTKRISLDFLYCGVQVLSSAFEVEIKEPAAGAARQARRVQSH